MDLHGQSAEFAAPLTELIETADAFSLQDNENNRSRLDSEQEATQAGMRIKTPQQFKRWCKYQAGLVYNPWRNK